MGWVEKLGADVRRYPGGTFRKSLTEGIKEPALWALLHYRIYTEAQDLAPPLRTVANVVLKPIHFAIKLGFGIELQKGSRIGKGLWIGHWGGIHISTHCTIGERCNLSQGVTIGVARGKSGRFGAPVIGDRVYVGPGAKIAGPIRIGNDVAIGANAVVVRDVPDGVSVGGVPARVISQKGSAGLIEIGQVVDEIAQVTRQEPNHVVVPPEFVVPNELPPLTAPVNQVVAKPEPERQPEERAEARP